MDAKEAVAKLDALGPPNPSDAEDDHHNAEVILCGFLRANGYADVADAFDKARERVGFWYG